jgi:hypothetical protein
MYTDHHELSALNYAIKNGHNFFVDLLVAAEGELLLSLTGINGYACLHSACQFES